MVLHILSYIRWSCSVRIKEAMALILKSRSLRGNERSIKQHRTHSFSVTKSEISVSNLPQVAHL